MRSIGNLKIPKRKHTRLKDYDYSQNGYYHVVICTNKMLPVLSEIVSSGNVVRQKAGASSRPTLPEISAERDSDAIYVGQGLVPAVKLTPIGEIAYRQLMHLSNRFSNISIDKFVIMPNHIHVIIIISGDKEKENSGKGPVPVVDRPALMDIIRTFKSLTTMLSNKRDNRQGRKIFQTSFYDKIIRNETVYHEVCRYIEENPLKWKLDEYYCGT